jgi:hypothetical protein
MTSITRDFRLSLSVRHPTLPARTLVEIVRRPARVSYSVGETRQDAPPNTSVAPYTHSYCRFRFDVSLSESLDDALLRHTARLRWDAPELHRVTHTGGDADLCVTWLVTRSEHCVVSPRTLSHLAALHVALKFDLFYAPPDAPPRAPAPRIGS